MLTATFVRSCPKGKHTCLKERWPTAEEFNKDFQVELEFRASAENKKNNSGNLHPGRSFNWMPSPKAA